ncbi:hypothetical protein BDFB_011505 [Asbolus verrucosus]|uniref:Uncharacterized protein n=1 Tax=Asbolus verrucosus TaxID=1661398 RepID=A0A482VZC6_ASBVE|nr:hypothetical protein BDFB_011505 [Asbolus verrucosus]
MLICLLCSVL